MKSGGIDLTIVCIVFHVLAMAAFIASAIWLSEWTTDHVINGTRTREDTVYRLGWYGGLLAVQSMYRNICLCFIMC